MARVWPLTVCLADFTAGPPNLPGGAAVDLLGPGSPVALRQFATSRGRQYELGTVQAGTLALDLTDTKEYLNPVNSGSPWNSGGNSLLPYRCVQLGAWWNTATTDTTGNMLNSTNSINASTTRFDPSFESGISGFYVVAGAATMATSATQHFAGAQSLQVTFNGASDTVGLGIPVPPGRQMTLSVYVFVPASHTATLTWVNFPGTYGSTIGSSTSSTTGAWQRLTVTGTPSAAVTVLEISCSAAYPATVFVDAMQLELGGAASAFTTAGPTWFPLYTGYIERYPQEWDSAGFRGLRPLEAVDALSPLSRAAISQSYAATVLADGPAVYVPYNDDSFPQVVQRPTGGQPMVPYQQLGSNSSSVTFGGDTFLDGSKAVSLVQQNTSPVTISDASQGTWLGTRQGGLSINPLSFTLETWVKFSSGIAAVGVGFMQPGETTVGETTGTQKQLHWFGTGGRLAVLYSDPNGNSSAGSGALLGGAWNGYPDGQWHHLVTQMIAGNQISIFVDGAFVRTVSPAGPWSTVVMGDNFYIVPTTTFGDPIAQIAVSNLAAYTSIITTTQIAKHYQRGIGYLGEKSGTRALRLLTQYWTSNVVTDTGVTSMAADFSYNGRMMLDVLQEIADTEGGLVWVDGGGFVHQDSRETRYVTTTSAVSQFTFGENFVGGELPYEDLKYDYDPTYVYSQANFTAGGSGTQLPPVVNSTSQTAYSQRILSKTLQMQNDWDVNQAAQFYVQRYAKPAGAPGTNVPPRIKSFRLNPASNPQVFKAVLDLDIGNRVTVKRRTSAGVTISGDYYIEQINHSVNSEASTWLVDYQLSPVFNPQVWILGDAVKGVLGSTTVCVY